MATTEAQFYVSVDSAPARYTDTRDGRAAPLFLVVFLLLSAMLALIVDTLAPWYAGLLSVFSGTAPEKILRPGDALSLRPFLLLFLILLAAFGNGSARERWLFGARAAMAYAITSVLSDTLLLNNRWFSIPSPLSQRGGVVAVVVGLAFVTWLVLTSYRLPEDVVVHPTRPTHHVAMILVAMVVLAGAAVVTLLTAGVRSSIASDTPLVNFYTSTVVCFLVLTTLTLVLVESGAMGTSRAISLPKQRRRLARTSPVGGLPDPSPQRGGIRCGCRSRVGCGGLRVRRDVPRRHRQQPVDRQHRGRGTPCSRLVPAPDRRGLRL